MTHAVIHHMTLRTLIQIHAGMNNANIGLIELTNHPLGRMQLFVLERRVVWYNLISSTTELFCST